LFSSLFPYTTLFRSHGLHPSDQSSLVQSTLESICVESPWEIASGQEVESATPILPGLTQADSKSSYRRLDIAVLLQSKPSCWLITAPVGHPRDFRRTNRYILCNPEAAVEYRDLFLDGFQVKGFRGGVNHGRRLNSA